MATKEKLSPSSLIIEGEELTEALVLIRTRANDLESVRKLNCWACNIGDVSVVRRMPNLEVCSLTINKLTSLQDFAHCYNLQELYVRTNNIQRLSDIHYLKNLTKLRSLWLSENPCAAKNNYRMTVLKTLPNLQKLDNIAVTGDEIARAQQEGDDLPVPNDFSFSAVFKDDSSVEYKDEKKEESVSESSEKWARPRQKRQQKKREDYWREIKGVKEESGSAKSGDESCGSGVRSGEDGGGHSMRSSSDSGDGDDWSKTKAEDVKFGLQNDDTEQIHEEEEVDIPGKGDDVTANDETRIEKDIDSSSQMKWAIKFEITNKITDKRVEDDIDSKAIETNLEENQSGSDHNNTICEKENDYEKKAFAQLKNTEQVLCASNELRSTSVFQSNFEVIEWSCNKSSLSVNDLGSDLAPAMFSTSIKVPDITAADSSTSASNNILNIIKPDSSSSNNKMNLLSLVTDVNLNCHDSYKPAVEVKITEQIETPLLDKLRLDDSLNVQDSVEDQTYPGDTLESSDPTDSTLELQLQKSSLIAVSSTQEVETTATDLKTWLAKENKQHEQCPDNDLNAQLGVGSVNTTSSTARIVNIDVIKNNNILQAVLCLVKDLDKDSLNILDIAVKERLDRM